jgi:peptide/nickel transport system ATP-binding protein
VTVPEEVAPSALVVDEMSVSTGDTVVVDRVRLTVAAGERVALLGPSGSGKSLTAAAALGALPMGFARTGHVALHGRPVAAGRKPRFAHREVSFVHQDSQFALNPLVPVGRQLTVPLRRRGLDPAAASAEAAALLGAVGIEDPARTLRGYAAELSGGQRQRVCIALALAVQARLLVADEPTTALDLVSQAQVLAALRSADGAVVLITHDLAVAAQLCDRAVVLVDGRVVEDGPMSRLLAAPSDPYVRQLVDEAYERQLVMS